MSLACYATLEDKPIAPLLNGMGNHHYAITTSDPMAQRYFNQGLVLAWGFNHKEAERSFREAARRDPECAMCWWGVSLVLGPNINAGMDPNDAPEAWKALQKARTLAPKASPKEQAYIKALGARYHASAPEDRSPLDQAYAEAMRKLVAENTKDYDAVTLYAEALMDLHPWDFWESDGTAKSWTGEILLTLEQVLEAQPDHPGANHLYIHAIEASKQPQRATDAADRLGDLVPGAGHLVHMPAHIYIRTGRYHDAVIANEIHDSSGPLFAHDWQRVAHAPNGSHELELQCLGPILFGEMFDDAAWSRAGIVHQNVDPTQLLRGRTHKAVSGKSDASCAGRRKP